MQRSHDLELVEESKIVIRRMVASDVQALVKLHRTVFKGYDNTMMGPAYLGNLYRTLASHVACISIVAERSPRIVGWIGGVHDWLSFQRTLTRLNILRAPNIFLSILKNRPCLLLKTFSFIQPVLSEIVQRSGRRNGHSAEPSPVASAALLVIGVAPHWQNQGVGQAMMKGFEQLLLSNGFAGISASTFKDNAAGNKAFQKAGYDLYRSHNGMNFYFKHLAERV